MNMGQAIFAVCTTGERRNTASAENILPNRFIY